MKGFIAVISVAILFAAACTKGGNQDGVKGNTYTVSSQLSSKKVFPALATDTSSGVFTGWYDETLNDLTFRFTYTKDTTIFKLDTIRVIRLFKSAANASDTTLAARRLLVNTAITVSSKTNITGAYNFGLNGINSLLTSEQSGFLAGSWYMVVYSAKLPNGMIGGALSLTKNP